VVGLAQRATTLGACDCAAQAGRPARSRMRDLHRKEAPSALEDAGVPSSGLGPALASRSPEVGAEVLHEISGFAWMEVWEQREEHYGKREYRSALEPPHRPTRPRGRNHAVACMREASGIDYALVRSTPGDLFVDAAQERRLLFSTIRGFSVGASYGDARGPCDGPLRCRSKPKGWSDGRTR
jgi:hypothetical protein